MAKRAVECFREQRYENKRMLIYDSGDICLEPQNDIFGSIVHVYAKPRGRTIGRLRNDANRLAVECDTEVLIHLDDDDWSGPERFAEQVDLLQSTGADVCGYNEAVFWNCRMCDRHDCQDPNPHGADGTGAWLYCDNRTDRAIGSSLCYTRSFWEKYPFADGPKPGVSSEYYEFIRAGKTVAVSSIKDGEPRLICSIHSSNHNLAHYEHLLAAAKDGRTNSWTRAPQFDNLCRAGCRCKLPYG
jgi:hypothetical protein